MISTSMPWNVTAGNGWKRNVESGVNGAEIAAVLQQKMQTLTDPDITHRTHLSSSCLADTVHMPACGMHKADIFWFTSGFV